MTAETGSAAIVARRIGYGDAARYLGISPGTLRSMVSRRQVPHIRISPRVVVFDIVQLDAWLAQRTVAVATMEPAAPVAADRPLELVAGGRR
jgi:predicted DNA-binding transcriptional regulator AlpA